MKCISCEQPLVLVWEGDEDNDYQFHNALWVGFYGGYGMFTDQGFVYTAETLPGAVHEAVLCHECAHELCNKIPWIGNLIQPLKSHSHTSEYLLAHPEHEGWDKKD